MDNQRSLKEIAEEIIRVWQYPYHDAIPYLDEMRTMDSIDDQKFGMNVVALFLYNASSWHGPEADRIKKELSTLFFMWYRSTRMNASDLTPEDRFTTWYRSTQGGR